MFRKVTAINPKFAAPYIDIGKMLLDTEKYEEAIEMFNEAIKRFPVKAQAYRLRGLL
jgi:tetratricopeptide (TPR) repeat protein